MNQDLPLADFASLLFNPIYSPRKGSSQNDNIGLPFIIMNMVNKAASMDKAKYCLSFTENISGTNVKRRIDFQSPRTKDAAARLGITFEDCVLK